MLPSRVPRPLRATFGLALGAVSHFPENQKPKPVLCRGSVQISVQTLTYQCHLPKSRRCASGRNPGSITEHDSAQGPFLDPSLSLPVSGTTKDLWFLQPLSLTLPRSSSHLSPSILKPLEASTMKPSLNTPDPFRLRTPVAFLVVL